MVSAYAAVEQETNNFDMSIPACYTHWGFVIVTTRRVNVSVLLEAAREVKSKRAPASSEEAAAEAEDLSHRVQVVDADCLLTVLSPRTTPAEAAASRRDPFESSRSHA